MSRNPKIRKTGAAPMVLALTLSTSIAMFGCTTDRTLGDGDPVVTPGVRTTPTSNVGGSESAPANPPMTSSSGVQMRSAPPPMSAAEAAALLVDNLPRVRVLGPSSPDAAERGYASEGLVTGQFVNPALETNPQLTVNSSISSQPVPAIASGAVGGLATGGAVVIGGTSGALISGVTTGTAAVAGLSNGSLGTVTTAPVMTSGDLATVGAAPVTTSGLGVGGNAAAVFVPADRTMTPTTAAPAFGAGVSGTVNRTLSPTTTALRNPTPTTAATQTVTPTTATRTSTATRRLNTRTTTTSGDVRIVRDANGRAVVTNADSD